MNRFDVLKNRLDNGLVKSSKRKTRICTKGRKDASKTTGNNASNFMDEITNNPITLTIAIGRRVIRKLRGYLVSLTESRDNNDFYRQLGDNVAAYSIRGNGSELVIRFRSI